MIQVMLASGLWRYLVGSVLMLALTGWLVSAAYRRGVSSERAQWTLRTATLERASAAAAAARASRAVAAERTAAARADAYAHLRAPITQEVIHYVATPAAAAVCPDLHGVQLGQAAIDAANAATAAAR